MADGKELLDVIGKITGQRGLPGDDKVEVVLKLPTGHMCTLGIPAPNASLWPLGASVRMRMMLMVSDKESGE